MNIGVGVLPDEGGREGAVPGTALLDIAAPDRRAAAFLVAAAQVDNVFFLWVDGDSKIIISLRRRQNFRKARYGLPTPVDCIEVVKPMKQTT
jgi:hypothetical protein